MTPKENSLNWFEISVLDINRAKKFTKQFLELKCRCKV